MHTEIHKCTKKIYKCTQKFINAQKRFTNVFGDLYIHVTQNTNTFSMHTQICFISYVSKKYSHIKNKIHKHISNAHTNQKKNHKYMNVKVFAIFIKYAFGACYIHI